MEFPDGTLILKPEYSINKDQQAFDMIYRMQDARFLQDRLGGDKGGKPAGSLGAAHPDRAAFNPPFTHDSPSRHLPSPSSDVYSPFLRTVLTYT